MEITSVWIDKTNLSLLPKKECDVIVNCMTPIGLRSEHRVFIPAECNEDGEIIDGHRFMRERGCYSWDDRFTHFIVFPEPLDID